MAQSMNAVAEPGRLGMAECGEECSLDLIFLNNRQTINFSGGGGGGGLGLIFSNSLNEIFL